MNLLAKMTYGSYLYGTNTPDSDTDYKGIFLPSKEQVYLGIIPRSEPNTVQKPNGVKNTKEDIDYEIYSLHYFLKLACEGQTVALDMLHVPISMILQSSIIWEDIVSKKELFYTKNVIKFIDFAKKQANKYSAKGVRLNTIRQTINILKGYAFTDFKLQIIWEELPVSECSNFIEDSPNGVKQYKICGKILQSTMSIPYAIDILQKYITNYGHRAYKAARNEGLDWKAISHALRAAFQAKQLLTENTITFPLKDADYILAVKLGKLDYLKEISPILDNLITEVELLCEKSNFPEEADKDYWEDYLCGILDESFKIVV